jgi:hypothetical protein
MAGLVGTVVRTTWRWLLDGQRAVRIVLALLLSVDAGLGLIHIVVMAGWDAPDIWRVDMDGSYGEAYQYAKYLWLIILLVVYARHERRWPLLAWVPLVAYFMFDDSLLIHERIGHWYATQGWAFGFGPLHAQSLGELATIAVIGVVLVAIIAIGYVRADTRTRWIFRVLIALTVVLLIFAVFLDAVHGLFEDVRLIDRSLGFFEDFGEMIVLTFMVVFAFRINVSGGLSGFAEQDMPQGAATDAAANALGGAEVVEPPAATRQSLRQDR